MTPPLSRVRVVGTSGSGKTTFARRLARALDAPHVELDEVFWGPGWVKRDVAEAHADLRSRTAGPVWVVDGNWGSRLGDLLDGADAVVWLDYPRRIVMTRVVWRTLRRGLTREELWHGNRENLANLRHLDPDQNVVLWSWTSHRRVAARYAERADDPRMVRLRGPRQAEAWLRAVERGSAR